MMGHAEWGDATPMRSWFSTSILFLISVSQSKIFQQWLAEVPGYCCIPWCSVLKTSLSFSCTGTLAEDTDAPLWFPCWLLLEGDTGLEKCLSQLGWVFFLPKWNLLLFYMDSQQIHKPQSWQLRYQTCHFWRNAFLCDAMTGNPCFMQPPCPPWEQILSNLLTGSYILFHPSFFPHFWEEENAALIITEKPDYF